MKQNLIKNKIDIGGIRFNCISRELLTNLIVEKIESEEECNQVVVANVYSIYAANNDNYFNEICNDAEIVLPDGLPIVWVSRLFGEKLSERIAGPDFMWSFSSVCAQKKYSMYLLGGRQECLDDLLEKLTLAFTGLKISGTYSPPFGIWDQKENDKIVEMINNSHVDVLWLGVSTPKQDKWIYENKHRLKVKVAFGVGAAFDFHSGRVKRAPIWMQKTGLEWTYRFLQEPKRMWKRYLFSNLLFLWIVIKQFFRVVVKTICVKLRFVDNRK